jgi:vacuolar-type H+-ATPase subunit H
MYRDLRRGIDRASTMIWRGQNSGAEDEGGDPREERRTSGDRSEASSIGRRVESVLEAAERAASEIRHDAEEWAQRHMEETRRRADELAAQRVQELTTVTDDLLARARTVATQSDELIAALDAAGRKALRLQPKERDDSPSIPEPPPERTRDRRLAEEPAEHRYETLHEEPRRDEPRREEPARNGRGVSEGARLLATQMAVAGSGRETIAARLREEFGIQDPSAILDDAGL